MARPSIYSEQLAVDICSELASGKPLTKICDAESMPCVKTVYLWLAAKPEFLQMYARAREDQADTLADEIIAIADEQAVAIGKDGVEYDPNVNRDRLRVDARKWIAAKLKPRKYGDKQEIEHSGNIAFEVVNYAGASKSSDTV